MSFIKGWIAGLGLSRSASRLNLDGLPDERYCGLENFGNTCYCNSVLQALYFCRPFRECVLGESPLTTATALYNYALGQSLGDLGASSQSSSVDSCGASSLSEASAGGPACDVSPDAAEGADSVSGMPVVRRSLDTAILRGKNGIRRRLSGKSSSSSTASGAVGPPKVSGAATPMPWFGCPYTSATAATPIPQTANTRALVALALALEKQDTLLSCLQDLFARMSTQKKRVGAIAPQAFVSKFKQLNELFRSSMHQDAHEFLNHVLNAIAETLAARHQQLVRAVVQALQLPFAAAHRLQMSLLSPGMARTWVHALFEGALSNETRCLTCESVTCRSESFLDLSLDVEPRSSLSACLHNFSACEMLDATNKFFCDTCQSLQEAERRLKLRQLPSVFAIHLKRFKYQERLQRYIKLNHEVLFSNQLRVANTCRDTVDPHRLYVLYAIVVHIGSALHHGHYVTLLPPATDAAGLTVGEKWTLLDDDTVDAISSVDVWRIVGGEQQSCVGGALESSLAPSALVPATPAPALRGTGYIFFYQDVAMSNRFSDSR